MPRPSISRSQDRGNQYEKANSNQHGDGDKEQAPDDLEVSYGRSDKGFEEIIHGSPLYANSLVPGRRYFSASSSTNSTPMPGVSDSVI